MSLDRVSSRPDLQPPHRDPELALVFPGQGAHALGMLEGVSSLPGFAARCALVEIALGASPLEAIARGDAAFINENRVAALLTVLVGSLSLDLFRAAHGTEPTFVAGYSVGQWTALYAAGALSFERLVEVVAKRSALMDACFTDAPGAMLAVIGPLAEPLEALTASCRAEGHRVWISNENCAGQTTLAGTADAIAAVEALLPELQPRKVLRVPVSGAWHTPLLAPAREAFAAYLAGIDLAETLPFVVDNVTGDELPRDPDLRRAALAAHLDHPVRWERGVRTMIGRGARRFVEVGYGNLLTKFDLFIDRSVEHATFYAG